MILFINTSILEAQSPAEGIFTVYRDATGADTISTTAQTLSWDTEVSGNPEIPLLPGDTQFDLSAGGHYLVMYSVPVVTTSGANRTETLTWLRLNDATNSTYGYGSSYTRRTDGDNDGYNEGAAILNVTGNDTLELQIQRTDTNIATIQRTANRSGINILKLDDEWDYAMLRGSTDQLVTTTWTDVIIDTEDELDVGTFSRSGNDLTLSNTGHYLVTYNVGYSITSTTRTNNETRLTLDGTEINGTRGTSYIRGQNGGQDGVASFVGIIETSGVNQVLNLETRRESSNAGTNNSVLSASTGLTITKLPDTAEYLRLGESGGGQDMTTAVDTPVNFDNLLEQDSDFNYSFANPSEVTINTDGDYLFLHSLYNSRTNTNNGPRESPFIRWLLNGTAFNYGNSGSYNRAANDGDGVSNSAASSAGIIMSGVNATDIVELGETNEGTNGGAAVTYTADRMGLQGVRIGSLFPPKPFMSQLHFRFRDDTADLDTDSGWLAGEDVEISDVVKDETVRLRFSLANTGTLPKNTVAQYRLQWGDAIGGTCGAISTWNNIQDTDDAWDMVSTTHIEPNAETSTSNYLANSEGYSFIETQGYDTTTGLTSIVGTGTLAVDNFLEYEFSLQSTVYAVTGNRYCFRLYDELGASELDAYNYPSLRVADTAITPNVEWGEAGSVSAPANGGWTTITYTGGPYIDPVIVGSSNTHNDTNEALVFEARNVGTTSAEVRLCDSNAGNATGCQTHGIETIGYIVVDASRTDDITGIEAGTFSVNESFDTVAGLVATTYIESFGATPYVFASTQTTTGDSPIVARISTSSATGFSGGICEQNSTDGCNGSHGFETYGWIAIDPSVDPFGTENELGSGNSTTPSQNWATATFATAFTTGTPSIIVQTVTNNGGQDVQIDEVQSVTTTGMEFRACELDNDDDCDTHAIDTVRWLAIEDAIFDQIPGDARYLDQTHYRFYENTDGITPSTALESENTLLNTLPVSGELRLRLLLQNGVNTLPSNSFQPKLQYGSGATCTSIGTWSDVGNPGGTEYWLMLDNPTPVNGTSITSSLLFGGTHGFESYNELNPSVVNPSTLLAGERGEWDFSIEENGIPALSQYCFRVVSSDNEVIHYSEYPQVDFVDLDPPVVNSSTPGSGSLMPIGNFDLVYDHIDIKSGVNTATGVTNFGVNLAHNAIITATANTIWGAVSGTGGIANGIISTTGTLDHEYHSDTANAFIEFNWDSPQKLGQMTIFNRVGCCSQRLTNATVELYDSTDTLVYTHTLGSTTGINEINIDFKTLGEVYEVSRLRLDSTGADSFINIREIEIYPIEENIEIQKWNGTTYDSDIAHTSIDFTNKAFTATGSSYPILGLPYGKYQMTYRIQDVAGNSTTDIREIYVDEVIFNISRPEIDLGDIGIPNLLYDSVDDLVITVETVGASFDVNMFPNTQLSTSGSLVTYWDGTKGIGYRENPFTGTVNSFATGALLLSQTGAINTNGDKNIYNYTLKYATLIENLEDFIAADDYIGSVDFNVDFAY